MLRSIWVEGNPKLWACDFLQCYDVLFRPLFAFFIIELGSRKVVQVSVTRSPSQVWTAQQLRNATPWGRGPRLLIRDNDDKFGADFDAVAKAADTSEKHLLHVLREYCRYVNESRPHQGLEQRVPAGPMNDNTAAEGRVVARPILGGLHHAYRRVA